MKKTIYKRVLVLTLAFLSMPLISYPQGGTIQNVQVAQRTDGSGNVDVWYDLHGIDNYYFISMEVSFDAGANYTQIAPSYLNGHIGWVDTGNYRHVVWNGKAIYDNTYSNSARIRFTASAPGYSPCPGMPNVLDTRNGKTYNTIQIGTQCWMQENMDIGERIDYTVAQQDNGIIEKHCYNNEPSNCVTYGGLYEWYELMQYSTATRAQGICPEGWHIPSDMEWCTLTTFIDPTIDCNAINYTGTDAGGKLKEAGTTHWLEPNVGATNSSGFTALPGGYSGNYYLGSWSLFFTSKKSGTNTAYGWYQENGSAQVKRGDDINTNNSSSVRCIKNTPNQPPATPSNPNPANGATGVYTPAILSWTCSDPDEDNLVYNVYFGTDPNPPLIESGLTSPTYTPEITASATYYWKIEAIDDNAIVTSGPVWSFDGIYWICGTSTLTDIRDNKTYNTVQIGTQCWMAQNLNVGTRITGTANAANNSIIEKYCYDNTETNCDVYGGLYQWNEMMNYSTTPGVQGICLPGWHLPTDAEWTTLSTYLGGESVAGGKMKETGTTHWTSPNIGATNSSGFTGLPGGYRGSGGSFGDQSNNGYWWSSSHGDGYYRWLLYLFYNDASATRTFGDPATGVSVRCLKD